MFYGINERGFCPNNKSKTHQEIVEQHLYSMYSSDQDSLHGRILFVSFTRISRIAYAFNLVYWEKYPANKFCLTVMVCLTICYGKLGSWQASNRSNRKRLWTWDELCTCRDTCESKDVSQLLRKTVRRFRHWYIIVKLHLLPRHKLNPKRSFTKHYKTLYAQFITQQIYSTGSYNRFSDVGHFRCDLRKVSKGKPR